MEMDLQRKEILLKKRIKSSFCCIIFSLVIFFTSSCDMYKNITHSVSNDMQERRDAKTESLMRSLNKEKTLYIVDTISLNNPVIVYYQKRYYVMDSITACKYNFNHLKMNWYLEDPNVYFVHRNGIILSYLYLEFIFGRVSQTNTVFNEAFFEDSIQKGKILPQKWVNF